MRKENPPELSEEFSTSTSSLCRFLKTATNRRKINAPYTYAICSKLDKEMGIKKKRAKNKHRITINVSGEVFETYTETLKIFPTTLLASEERRAKYFCGCTQVRLTMYI